MLTLYWLSPVPGTYTISINSETHPMLDDLVLTWTVLPPAFPRGITVTPLGSTIMLQKQNDGNTTTGGALITVFDQYNRPLPNTPLNFWCDPGDARCIFTAENSTASIAFAITDSNGQAKIYLNSIKAGPK